jgi:5S rRNA maturation endonuclease (ribonuclease M5)
VIYGIDPISAYLCDEGLARFCTHNYSKPNSQNLKNVYMHLTNFSINKKSQKFRLPNENFKTDNQSHKQLFTSVLKQIMNMGKDIKPLLEQIKSLSQKVVIALQPYLKNAYHCFISTNYKKPRSFQILGLDILIDENMHAWLVEINANPSLNVYNDTVLPNGDIEQNLSEVDKYVKTMLISDTLRIVTMERDQIPNYTEIGCLKKILPPRSQ